MELFMKKGDMLFVKLPDEIDHHKVSGLALEVDKAIVEKEPQELVFDFSNVRFMDSSGIGLLIGRYRNMHCVGGKVYTYGASGHMAKLIALSGIEKYIGKYEETK